MCQRALPKKLGSDHLVAIRPDRIGATSSKSVSLDMDVPISSVH